MVIEGRKPVDVSQWFWPGSQGETGRLERFGTRAPVRFVQATKRVVHWQCAAAFDCNPTPCDGLCVAPHGEIFVAAHGPEFDTGIVYEDRPLRLLRSGVNVVSVVSFSRPVKRTETPFLETDLATSPCDAGV